MRVAVLSDVHANMEALEAIFSDPPARTTDAIWHLGDLVGYGPDPERVIELMVEKRAVCVMGNHDAAAAGTIDTGWFNAAAAEAALWTADAISESSRHWLASLPEVLQKGEFTLSHGSLREPLWEYLSTFESARSHLALLETQYSCVGHTHLPLVVRELGHGEVEATAPLDGAVVPLGEERLCFNPGSGGQPRDGDPRVAYAVLDLDARNIAFHRVAYDVATTQRRMREAGLPESLVTRLEIGR